MDICWFAAGDTIKSTQLLFGRIWSILRTNSACNAIQCNPFAMYLWQPEKNKNECKTGDVC